MSEFSPLRVLHLENSFYICVSIPKNFDGIAVERKSEWIQNVIDAQPSMRSAVSLKKSLLEILQCQMKHWYHEWRYQITSKVHVDVIPEPLLGASGNKMLLTTEFS